MITTRIFEFVYITFFLLIIYSNYNKKQYKIVAELFSIALFALLLEYLSIKTYDAYQYSSDFIFQFGKSPDNVPIVIAFAWSIIIGVSMKISDATGIHEKTKPFFDTLLALTIDLSMDAIAIRIDDGLWNWKVELSNSISYSSFIGVRYGNFIGWYLIVLIFSTIIRIGRLKIDSKYYYLYLSIIPFLSFIPFYILFELIQQGKYFINHDAYFLLVIIFLISIALIITKYGFNKRYSQNDYIQLVPLEIISFYSFHPFFLIALIWQDLYKSTPLLIIPSIFALLIHYTLHFTLLSNKSIMK